MEEAIRPLMEEEDVVEEALVKGKRQMKRPIEEQIVTGWWPDMDLHTNGENAKNNESNGAQEEDKSVDLDKNDKDAGKKLIVGGGDIPRLVDSLIINQQNKELILPNIDGEEHKNDLVRIDIVDEDEEDVIELEFERAVDKIHTHTAYCPNCSSRITKVILRRRKREDIGIRRLHNPPLDAFGCLSCFSIFIPSGNVLNPFRLFGRSASKRNDEVHNNQGRAFDLFGFLRRKGDDGNTRKSPGLARPQRSADSEHPPVEIDEGRGNKSLEILKCIVYGGLVESITSLSIVSSAVASDATTLNVVAIAVANLVSGLSIIGNNLISLKNEESRENTSQNNTNRYQELLGRKENFLLHATLAILSFIVFGIVPPAVYGFSFLDTDNKDYKMAAVAAASFACIVILSMAKAYTQRSDKFSAYLKTILHYVMLAILGGGIGYGVGDAIKIFLQRLGWFEQNSVAPSFRDGHMSSSSLSWGSY